MNYALGVMWACVAALWGWSIYLSAQPKDVLGYPVGTTYRCDQDPAKSTPTNLFFVCKANPKEQP